MLSGFSLKTDEGFLLGFVLFCMCVGFHCSISVLFDCYNGAAFPSGELHSFLGFRSGPTKLVGDTGSIMLQRWKYGQGSVMSLLFANVAHS
jgi:hypothetical protein